MIALADLALVAISNLNIVVPRSHNAITEPKTELNNVFSSNGLIVF